MREVNRKAGQDLKPHVKKIGPLLIGFFGTAYIYKVDSMVPMVPMYLPRDPPRPITVLSYDFREVIPECESFA